MKSLHFQAHNWFIIEALNERVTVKKLLTAEPCVRAECYPRLIKSNYSLHTWSIINYNNIYHSSWLYLYCFRSLRKQSRIRLHIHFFTVLLLKEILSIIWDVFVTYDKLNSDTVYTTTLAQNPVSITFLIS